MKKDHKENAEIEKVKIEKLKAYTELLKLWSFLITTLGAGIFTLIFWIYGKGKELLEILLIIGITTIVILAIKFIKIEREIDTLLKELKKKE